MEGTAASADNTKKLVDAIRAGDKAGMDALLTEQPELLKFAAPSGSSAILLTAYLGHAELTEVFVKHGAKLDLFEACAIGDFATVRELAEADAGKVNSFAPDGFHPLGLAAFFQHREIVEYLLENGADVNLAARNAQKVTALHGAVARGNLEIVKVLLKAGADPNARQERGFVPLHDAGANGNAALVELLLAAGAQPDAKSDEGKTPGEMTAARGHAELAKRLAAK